MQENADTSADTAASELSLGTDNLITITIAPVANLPTGTINPIESVSISDADLITVTGSATQAITLTNIGFASYDDCSGC